MNNVKANKSAHKESVRDLRYVLMHISSWIFFMKLFIIKFYLFDQLLSDRFKILFLL